MVTSVLILTKKNYNIEFKKAYDLSSRNAKAGNAIAENYCDKVLPQYLDEYKKNILTGDPLWYLNLPHNLLSQEKNLRLINAIAYIQGLKMEIYQKIGPSIYFYVVSPDESWQPKPNSIYYNKFEGNIYYLDIQEKAHFLRFNDDDGRRSFFKYLLPLNVNNTPFIKSFLTEKQVNFMFFIPSNVNVLFTDLGVLNKTHVYESPIYQQKTNIEKENFTARLFHHHSHFDLLIYKNDAIAKRKALIQEMFFDKKINEFGQYPSQKTNIVLPQVINSVTILPHPTQNFTQTNLPHPMHNLVQTNLPHPTQNDVKQDLLQKIKNGIF